MNPISNVINDTQRVGEEPKPSKTLIENIAKSNKTVAMK